MRHILFVLILVVGCGVESGGTVDSTDETATGGGGLDPGGDPSDDGGDDPLAYLVRCVDYRGQPATSIQDGKTCLLNEGETCWQISQSLSGEVGVLLYSFTEESRTGENIHTCVMRADQPMAHRELPDCEEVGNPALIALHNPSDFVVEPGAIRQPYCIDHTGLVATPNAWVGDQVDFFLQRIAEGEKRMAVGRINYSAEALGAQVNIPEALKPLVENFIYRVVGSEIMFANLGDDAALRGLWSWNPVTGDLSRAEPSANDERTDFTFATSSDGKWLLAGGESNSASGDLINFGYLKSTSGAQPQPIPMPDDSVRAGFVYDSHSIGLPYREFRPGVAVSTTDDSVFMWTRSMQAGGTANAGAVFNAETDSWTYFDASPYSPDDTYQWRFDGNVFAAIRYQESKLSQITYTVDTATWRETDLDGAGTDIEGIDYIKVCSNVVVVNTQSKGYVIVHMSSKEGRSIDYVNDFRFEGILEFPDRFAGCYKNSPVFCGQLGRNGDGPILECAIYNERTQSFDLSQPFGFNAVGSRADHYEVVGRRILFHGEANGERALAISPEVLPE